MSEEFPVIQYSFFCGGKDQFVIRGNSPDDVIAVMRDLVETEIDGVPSKLSDVLGYQVLIQAAHAVVVPQPKQPQPAAVQAQSTPQQANTAAGPGQSCQHGTMVYKTGTSARGPWKGYFCPGPRGEQCKPVFLK
jgi:hypothetical protein